MSEINGESTSMVWPTLGSRTAKEHENPNPDPISPALSLILVNLVLIHSPQSATEVWIFEYCHIAPTIGERSIVRSMSVCPQSSRMSFLTPNQQRQSTEGNTIITTSSVEFGDLYSSSSSFFNHNFVNCKATSIL